MTRALRSLVIIALMTTALAACGGAGPSPVDPTASSVPPASTSTTGSPSANPVVGGSPSASPVPGPVNTTRWTATGSLTAPRSDHVAVLLADGRVLVVGGNESSLAGDLYDPVTGTWTATDPMLVPRGRPTATRLRDGTVLVAGGAGADRLASAELYDPATGAWTATGSMNDARAQHVAVLLKDGKVLVAGGTGGDPKTRSTELYDPETGAWTITGLMIEWRASPPTTLLGDGSVLVASGFGPGSETTTAERYDPTTGTWASAGTMSENRIEGSLATLLPDGRVLVTGYPHASAELYDPQTGSWTLTASVRESVGGHTATLLLDGTVLVAGGIDGVDDNAAALAVTQSYDPRTGSWTAGPPMVEARYSGAAVLLDDGRVLVMGGIGHGGGASASAEVYDPGRTPGPSSAAPRRGATAGPIHRRTRGRHVAEGVSARRAGSASSLTGRRCPRPPTHDLVADTHHRAVEAHASACSMPCL